MKPAMIVILLVVGGCVINGEKTSDLTSENQLVDETIIWLKEKEPTSSWLSVVTSRARDFWQDLRAFFSIKDQLPAYCGIVLMENPTREDFDRSWQSEAEAMYCPGSDGLTKECEKRRDESHAALLDCYRN